MRIVTRKEWGARPASGRPIKVAASSRTAVCVHHDGASPITVRTFAEACALMRRDQGYHMDHNGWDDIGYNYLTVSAAGYPAIDGLIFTGRGRDIVGAHCGGHNTPWIGIQVAIGGNQQPSAAALASVRWLHDSFEAAAGHHLGKKGHRDGFPTACPGELLYAWVLAGMPVPTRAPASKPIPTTVPTSPGRMPLSVKTWQQLLAFAPDRRDGVFGPATEQRSQWMVTAALHQGGTLSGSADTTVRLIQRIIGLVGRNVDGIWGPKSRAAMSLWIKRVQRLLGVGESGVWDAPTQVAYDRFHTAHRH